MENYLKSICWDDIREELSKLNPRLVKIIDAIEPDPKLTLFKVTYRFGDKILQSGKLFLPQKKHELVPLTSLSEKIQEKLSYNLGTNPVSIVLDGTVEIFMVIDKHSIPLYGLIPKGRIFSASRVLSPNSSNAPAFLWDMTAGARSIFMLPKISENIGHARIEKHFKIQFDKPINYLDHWRIFKEITVHSDSVTKWNATMLFFSKDWFTKLNDPKWQDFKYYLLQQAWHSSEYWRNQFTWDIVRSVIQKSRKLRPSPYDADTVAHLIDIAAGAVPGFAPATNNFAAPINEIQKIYQDIYQIKYDPIIMQPTWYSIHNPDRFVYYSLQYPSTLKFSPKAREPKSIISELYIIYMLLQKYLDALKNDNLNIQGTSIFDAAKLTNFDSFHSKPTEYPTIKNSQIIPEQDKTFSSMLKSNLDFPINSSFLKGCIRIGPYQA
jgi:hypothetical protein